MSSGSNARQRVWENFTVLLLDDERADLVKVGQVLVILTLLLEIAVGCIAVVSRRRHGQPQQVVRRRPLQFYQTWQTVTVIQSDRRPNTCL